MNQVEVFKESNKNYNGVADKYLTPSLCNLSMELNGAWELTIEHPCDDEKQWKEIKGERVVRVFTPAGKKLFRIYEVRPSYIGIVAYARPIFLDSADEVFIIDKRVVNKNGQDALNHLLEDQNKYSASSDISKSGSFNVIRRSFINAINSSDGSSFLSIFGGEVFYNDFQIIVNERIGGDNGARAALGYNLTGIEYDINYESVVTRAIPLAFNGRMLPEEYIDSTYIDRYQKIYNKKIELNDLKLKSDSTDGEEGFETLEELYEAMRESISSMYEDGIDLPVINYKVSIIDISKTDEYKDIKELVSINLGDTVVCRNKELDVDTIARVISLNYNCVYGEIESLELGAYKDSVIDLLGKSQDITTRVEGAITPEGTIMGERIAGVLNAMNVSLKAQKDIAHKLEQRAFFAEDLDPESPTFGALSIGTQGIQLAKERNETNTDWKWGTAMDFQTFHAQYMAAGILSDKLGKNYWNLDTGDARFAAGSVPELDGIESSIAELELKSDEISLSVEGVVRELDEETQIRADAFDEVNASIVGMQKQLDGETSHWYYSGTPTLSNAPASEWTTDVEKERHIGDTYLNIATTGETAGFAYRFEKINNNYVWTLIPDTQVAEALRNAQLAQETADSKITTYTIKPTKYSKGDLWILESDWNGFKRGTMLISNATSATFVNSHWQDNLRYTDDTVANQVRSELDVEVGNINLSVSALNRDLTTAESQIAINTEGITQKVTKGDVSSQISQEAGAIDIKANRFSLESTNAKISKEGNVEFKNGKFTGDITGSSISGSEFETTQGAGRFRIAAGRIYSQDVQTDRTTGIISGDKRYWYGTGTPFENFLFEYFSYYTKSAGTVAGRIGFVDVSKIEETDMCDFYIQSKSLVLYIKNLSINFEGAGSNLKGSKSITWKDADGDTHRINTYNGIVTSLS